jgi:hypothetical protein
MAQNTLVRAVSRSPSSKPVRPKQIAPTMDAFAMDFEPKADAGDIAAGAGERAHKPRDDHIAGQADDGNAGTWRFLTSSRAWASLRDKT